MCQLLADAVGALLEQFRGSLAFGHFLFALASQSEHLFKCHNNRPLDFTAVKIEKCRPIAPLYGLPGLASGLCSGAWGSGCTAFVIVKNYN